MEDAMKAMILIPVTALSLYAMQAYAASDAGTSPDPNGNATMTAESYGGTTAGTSSSGAIVGKTRNEVYQELIRAKQDGTIDRLNQLYYGGGN
jgi:hypothetical protein